MTNFDGIFAKISRADDQASSLKADMDRLCADIRQSIVHEVHEDADEQVWVFRGSTPNVPIEWFIRLGEILYNLRSALDHLVWQLVFANGREPGRHNSFPIIKNEDDWQTQKTEKRWMLKGVSQSAEDTIQCLQPYTGGINLPFDVAVFQTLHTLCNIDKHRHLILAIIGSYGIESVDFRHNHPPLDRPNTSPLPQGLVPLGKIEKGRVMLLWKDARVTIDPNFQLDVRFEDVGQPEVTAGTVPDILGECIEAVQGAVEILTNRVAEHRHSVEE